VRGQGCHRFILHRGDRALLTVPQVATCLTPGKKCSTLSHSAFRLSREEATGMHQADVRLPFWSAIK